VRLLLGWHVFAWSHSLSAAVEQRVNCSVFVEAQISNLALYREYCLLEDRVVENCECLLLHFSVSCVIKVDHDSLVTLDTLFDRLMYFLEQAVHFGPRRVHVQ